MKDTWDHGEWKKRGLPEATSQALTVKFIEMQREGFSLYTMTLMFGWVPGLLKPGGNGMEVVKRRVETLWDGVQNRLFNRPENKGSFGVVFWDKGEGNDRNKGFHAHMVFGFDEGKFKGKYRGSFLDYWRENESHWINRSTQGLGTPDPLVRTWLEPFDGREAGLRYYGKSVGLPGIEFGDILYLAPVLRRNHV